MKLGDQLPDISLPATGNKTINLADYKGKKVVVYFYPRDNTPGCTTQGLEFSAAASEFEKHNAVIFGVSCDTLVSHEKFKAKKEFVFDLISDTEQRLCNTFEVYKLKKNYGKEYMGIERSTFVFKEDGKLANEWRKVRVKEHASKVLAALAGE